MYRAKALGLGLVAIPLLAFACGDDPESLPSTEVPDASGTDVATPETSIADGGSTDEPWKAGSRLVPRFLTTTDGMKAFVGIFDTKLDTTCFPTKDYDAVSRCAPLYSQSFNTVFYADAACTRPVVAELAAPTNGCAADRFVAVTRAIQNPGPCSAGNYRDLHKVVAAKIDLPKVYEKNGQACAEAANPAGSYTELGAIKASEMVMITDEIDPVSTAISRNVYAGEDGSRFPQYALVDNARDKAACVPDSEVSPKASCIPVNGARANGFTDNGCSKKAVVKDECKTKVDPNESYVIEYTSESCASTAKLYEIGPKRATREIYYGPPEACAGPSQHTSDVFDIGAVVDPAKFPELAYVMAGGTRMQVRTYTSEGKLATFLQETFFDKTLDAVCQFVVLQDGKTRCAPVFSTGAIQFSDPTCETKVVVELTTDCAPPKYLREPVDGPPGLCRTQFPGTYEVGAKLAGTTAYRKVNNGCELATNVKAIYTLGPLLPPSTFAEATYVPK